MRLFFKNDIFFNKSLEVEEAKIFNKNSHKFLWEFFLFMKEFLLTNIDSCDKVLYVY